MPEWLIERGIGETRAARVSDGEIIDARVLVDDIVPAGTLLAATLKRSGVQLFATAGGQDYLLPNGAPGISDGAALTVEVTRERIPGTEPWKHPLAKVRTGPSQAAQALEGRSIAFPSPGNELNDAGWDELIEQARSGIVAFDGGELRIFPTPAMTLIDVDGTLKLDELARRAAAETAKALVRLGIGGSIGIDFPTVAGKSTRGLVDGAIDEWLPKPFERTSLNGFGFLQIVRPRRHASLVELAQDRASFEARALLRKAGFEHGAKRLVAHPAVIAVIETGPGWIEALARQIGGAVTLRAEPNLPMSGGYAENS